LPKNAEEIAHRASIRERNQKGHLQGSEATKFLQDKFARRVDRALCAALARRSAPLLLAADEPLASIYRSINTYPGLVDETIAGNPNLLTDAQLEDAALPILDRLYERQLKAVIVRFDELKNAARHDRRFLCGPHRDRRGDRQTACRLRHRHSGICERD
jgi:hypothetical protein